MFVNLLYSPSMEITKLKSNSCKEHMIDKCFLANCWS